jgi:uncharacterized membrane protein
MIYGLNKSTTYLNFIHNMDFYKICLYFCFITYPLAMTFIIISKLEKDYNNTFLIFGIILVILDSLGLIVYCCKKKHEIQEK